MATTRQRYRMYGWEIASDLPLPAGAGGGGPPDFEIEWCGERRIATARPAGGVLAEVDLGNGDGHAWVDDGDATIGRFYATAEFRIPRAGSRVEAWSEPGGRSAMTPILLAGSVLGFALVQRGHCVLHASAVERSGSVVAFSGSSGMGKSTLAALGCAAGARLVTDDVLRVERAGNELLCHGGVVEIRLRADAAGLAVPLDGASRGLAADGRVTLRPEAQPAALPLAAVAIPRPERAATKLELEPLRAADALEELIRHPRVLGIRDVALLREQFRHAAEVVRRVPVFRAVVPWGPPFPRDLGDEILGRLAR